MNDPRKFKAPYNPKERIWQEADRMRGSQPLQIPKIKELLKKVPTY